MDLSPLRSRFKQALAISLTGMCFCFVLGLAISTYLYNYMLSVNPSMSETSTPTAFMIFTGVSLSITEFPVLARIMNEKKLLQCDVGKCALAAAAISDVSAWCLLVVAVAIAGISQGGSPLTVSLGMPKHCFFLVCDAHA